MKNVLIIAATAALALVSCTKDSNLSPTSSINEGVNEVQRTIEEGFVVGSLDASNNATLSYDIAQLEDLCACAVGEAGASNLSIIQNANGEFALSGNATSSNFEVSLILDAGDQLIWSETSIVSTCQNSAAGCVLTPIGDGFAQGSEPCDWPWMAKSSKDRK